MALNITQVGSASGPLDALLNSNEAATAIGMSRRTLQLIVSRRELASVKIGRSIRFKRSDVEEFIERRRDPAVGWKRTSATRNAPTGTKAMEGRAQ